MIVVFTLVVVLLAGNGQPGSYTREFTTELDCHMAALAAHEAGKTALGILDVGTICIRSELSPNLKPRA